MEAANETESEELKKIKSEIRSLLISRPSKTVLLNTFLSDYKQTVGRELPFRRFKFQTPYGFLMSLTDVVEVSEGRNGLQLTAVVSELSSHIKELVGGQKKAKSPYHRRGAPRVFHREPQGTQQYSGIATYYHPPRPPVIHVQAVPYGRFGMTPWFQHPAPYMLPPACPPVWSRDPQPYLGQPLIPPVFTPPLAPPIRRNINQEIQDHQEPPAQESSTVEVDVKPQNILMTQNTAKTGEDVNDSNTQILSDGRKDGEGDEVADLAPQLGNSPGFASRFVNKASVPLPTNLDNLSGFDLDLVRDLSICSRSLIGGSPAERRHSALPVGAALDRTENTTPAPGQSGDSEIYDSVSVVRNSSESGLKFKDQPLELSSSLKSKILLLLDKFPNGISTSVFLEEYQKAHSEVLDLASLGYSSLKDMVLKNEEVFAFEKSKDRDDWLLHDGRLKPKRRQDPGKRWIPYQVVDNLAELARSHRDGIDAREILELYKSKFGISVHPENLGFKNVYSFLERCDSICLRMYGDVGFVYPKGWTATHAGQTLEDAMIVEPALPPPEEMKHHWSEFFEEYECDPTFKFKPPLIPEEKLVRVKLVDGHSPALLWLHFIDDVKDLPEMMDALSEYYEKEEANCVLPAEVALPGLAVAALFHGTWHRGIILSVEGSKAQITYVDYGTCASEEVGRLRKLDRKFAQHPLCAVRASLYCLAPSEGDEWSLASWEFLYNHWSERILFAELCTIDYKEPSVEVTLYETSAESEININDLLVERKFAKYLVKPESVMNESSVPKFFQFLPQWFSYSQKTDFDGDICLKNLLTCSSGNIEPIDCETIPCCKAHCFQVLLRANPEAMAKIWRKAIEPEEKRIMSNLMKLLETLLGDLEWSESCTALKDFCNEISEPAPADLTVGKLPEELVRGYDAISPVNEPMQNGPTTHSSSVGSSVPPVGSTRGESNSAIAPRCRLVPMPGAPYVPRVIKYLSTQGVTSSELTLILYEEKIRVCLSQLVELVTRRQPKVLFLKTRIANILSPLENIIVTAEAQPALFEDLTNLNLIEPGQTEETVLVLLDDAPTIIQTISPSSSYHDVFRALTLQVSQMDCWVGPNSRVPQN